MISTLRTQAKVTVAAQGRRPVGEEYVKMLLLSQRALDEHLDSSPALRSRLELERAETLAEAQYQKMWSEAKFSEEKSASISPRTSQNLRRFKSANSSFERGPKGPKTLSRG